MKTIKEEIACNLVFYRKKSKMTQKALADVLGVKDNTITQWEKGVNSIDIEVLFNICGILKVDINDMFGEYAIGGDRFNQREKELIFAYRDNPEMQAAVDKLLNIEQKEGEKVKIFRAARSENNAGPQDMEVSREKLNKINNASEVTEI